MKSSKTISSLIVSLFILLLSSVSKANPETISIGADPWCPYNCDPYDENQGLMVDIASAALALSNYKLDYKIINWARAKRLVQLGKLDGIIGMSRNKNSEPLYYFPNTPLGRSQVCIYKLSNKNWEYKSTDSLHNKTFGWINGYGFATDPLDQWVKDHASTDKLVNLAGTDVHGRLFKLMQLGRIDTFAEDRNVIAFELKKRGMEQDFSIAGCLESVDNVHLAFSLKSINKEKWANALDSGIYQLFKNGQLERILSPYGLTIENWLDKNKNKYETELFRGVNN